MKIKVSTPDGKTTQIAREKPTGAMKVAVIETERQGGFNCQKIVVVDASGKIHLI